jgi:Thioredoxin-like [2Fe-2S] ferredoxin
VECLAACDGAPVVQVNTENYERLSTEEALGLLEALLRDQVPPPTFAADGSVTEPSTAALHWRLAGLGDPPAAFGGTAAAAAEPTTDGQGAARSVGREPSPPEPTEQREAGEPQPEEGAGAAAPEAPTEPEPQAPEAAHEAPGDEGPAPEDEPRPQAGEGR